MERRLRREYLGFEACNENSKDVTTKSILDEDISMEQIMEEKIK